MRINKIKQKLRITFIQFVKFILTRYSKLLGREAVFEFNEFTWDMVRGLPKAYFFEKKKIKYNLFVKKGLSNTYFFSSNVYELDLFQDLNPKETYKKEMPSFTNFQWEPPPLKEIFKDKNIKFEKEVIVIQNKFAIEWGKKPYNYFDLDILEKLFIYLSNKYQIVYIRPESANKKGYFQDNNQILNFNDYGLIKDRFPHIFTLKDFMSKEDNFNKLQFKIHANSSKHICVSGGNACIASYFGGEVLIFDSLEGIKREIWETDSWLKNISGSKIIGFDNKNEILNFVKNNW